MTAKEFTLEQRLSMLLSALEDSAGVTVEIQQNFARQLRELEAERDQLRKGAEQDRAKLSRVSDEAVQSVSQEARKAASELVSSVSLTTAATLQRHQQPIVDSLVKVNNEAKTTEANIKQTLEDLAGGWKLPALKVLGVWGSGLVLTCLVSWLVWSAFDFKERLEEQQYTAYAEKTALLKQQYDAMKAEVEKWEATKANQTALEPCPAPIDHLKCVRVDKGRGALGKGKDLFVPASVD